MNYSTFICMLNYSDVWYFLHSFASSHISEVAPVNSTSKRYFSWVVNKWQRDVPPASYVVKLESLMFCLEQCTSVSSVNSFHTAKLVVAFQSSANLNFFFLGGFISFFKYSLHIVSEAKSIISHCKISYIQEVNSFWFPPQVEWLADMGILGQQT